jgi:hypothetical protein
VKFRSIVLAVIVAGGLVATQTIESSSAEARTVYVGSANGGVWKTTDGGGNTYYVGGANGGVWR